MTASTRGHRNLHVVVLATSSKLIINILVRNNKIKIVCRSYLRRWPCYLIEELNADDKVEDAIYSAEYTMTPEELDAFKAVWYPLHIR